MSEIIWFDRAREHFYSIPKGVRLPAGDVTIRNLRGGIQQVDVRALAGFQVSREEANARISARAEKAWSGVRSAWGKLLDMGEQAASQVGVSLPEGARPELPELADMLGTEPGELLTEPGAIGQKVRAAVKGAELNHAIAGLGAALQRLGEKIQEQSVSHEE